MLRGKPTIEDGEHDERDHNWLPDSLREARNQGDAGSSSKSGEKCYTVVQANKDGVGLVQSRNLKREIVVSRPEYHAICEEAPQSHCKVAILLEQVVMNQAIPLE